ncbi:hypothetical protein JYT95_01050 [bacterium AH-315-J23]|nr:hypothetical protein [bacterium AH-315-J23]
MPHHTLKLSPAIPAIEQCCLTKLDKRFVNIVQFALLALSFNLLNSFPLGFSGLVVGVLLATLFMIKGQQVWAYALAKLMALVLLITFCFDVLAHIPLLPLPALSSETINTSLVLYEVLGIWFTGMLLSNLRPVPIGKLSHFI